MFTSRGKLRRFRLTRAFLLCRSSNAALIGPEKELRIGLTLRLSVDYFNLHNFFAQLSAGKEAERLSAYLFEKVRLWGREAEEGLSRVPVTFHILDDTEGRDLAPSGP